MKIRIAEHCGFCSGVRNAVDLAGAALEKYGRVAVTGDLVHNKVVMDRLKQKGLVFVKDLEDVGDLPLLLRAHGTNAALVYTAREMGIDLIDGTCPLVKKIHDHALELESEGRQVIVIGDRDHDEVQGIVSRLHDYCVVQKAGELKGRKIKRRTGVVVQSTQLFDNVREIVSGILTISRDCRIINTICEPTRRNQEEVRELAMQNDGMLIIGDPASANSKRLFTVSRSLNRNSHMVAEKADIDASWFRNCESLGITAGASTPGDRIIDIVDYIKTLNGDRK
ncbi:MAG: 4-hydroxy-3-methylbut-2-enyl diphosphate reductase [Candidatus Marinimicrobia bacterium]|nr:4-hydroxy-3-methylbut-2-enyl diphosphate reductase [Candidatus Neomarinimicrobiota bacterium]